MAGTGVFVVGDNKFKVGSAKDSATSIADIETFSVSFTNGVEHWTPMEANGWQRSLMTAKAVTITLNGKRNVGDTGNDFVAEKLFKNGRDAEGYFCWEFPDGTLVEWDEAVFDVKNVGSGESTKVAPLEVDIHSNGKPTVTTAAKA